MYIKRKLINIVIQEEEEEEEEEEDEEEFNVKESQWTQ